MIRNHQSRRLSSCARRNSESDSKCGRFGECFELLNRTRLAQKNGEDRGSSFFAKPGCGHSASISRVPGRLIRTAMLRDAKQHAVPMGQPSA